MAGGHPFNDPTTGNIQTSNLVNIIQVDASAPSVANGYAFSVASGTLTALTASTEYPSFRFNGAATKTWTTGNFAVQRNVIIDQPTYAADGATTINEAGNFVITGAPIEGSNMTITNPYSFWVQAGLAQFDAGLTVAGVLTVGNGLTVGTITSSGNINCAGTITASVALVSGDDLTVAGTTTIDTGFTGIIRADAGVLSVDSTLTNTTAGTYTPTRSAEANLDADVTMSQAQYMRVGSVVTVSGQFTADPALAATATSFEITLPVASNIGAVADVAGTAVGGSIAGMSAAVTGVAANDTAKIFWVATDLTSQVWSYTFTYRII